ncbi:hypothetical protein QMK19_22985 [Streptomyces sp. H10-C2]|uniref:hypothetical protein n=1 Tax=unclassified Streptomyces TaxID=2593676 RepID=UPI0024B88798|nr:MULTISPECIES: hypothetical protein [unclassified Streptomyces]MDJ0342771.1 hypothetical protein [Streptomyces sp. PH10-H1]MDJ0372449.1 hypothetical protein [Streptomyces sp. H10-C2]
MGNNQNPMSPAPVDAVVGAFRKLLRDCGLSDRVMPPYSSHMEALQTAKTARKQPAHNLDGEV